MVTIKIDLDKCNGDGACVTVCPVGVYELKKKNGVEKSEAVNADQCIVCRACEVQCPEAAITVTE